MSKLKEKIGIVLVNLGTPAAPTPKAVRQYLAEFLWDPYIVQISRPIWWLILHGIILRLRPKKTARLYQKIWTSSGSPLLVFSKQLRDKIQANLQERGYSFEVILGMRYGQPSLQEALLHMQKTRVTRLVIFPLYPQYSTPTTGSTLAEVKKQLKKLAWQPDLEFIHDYHESPSYLDAITNSVQSQWQKRSPSNLLLFSFHGLPQKYIAQGDPYYDQCHQTASKIATKLMLAKKNWVVVFQSRFGREQWLEPYCDHFLAKLPNGGIKQIDILCPGFPVDCLETLEEIAITNKELFHKAGGTLYNYIPALNDSPSHAHALVDILIDFLEK